MSDYDIKLRISAEDGTKEALKAMTSGFKEAAYESARGIKTLADGTKVNLEQVGRAAMQMGVSRKAMLDHMQMLATAAAKHGKTIKEVNAEIPKTTSATSGLTAALLAGTRGFAGMAAQVISVAAVVETARRSFIRFADVDKNLRLVQNQTGQTTRAVKGLGEEMTRVARITGDSTDEILAAVEELREKGNLSPAEAKRLIPDLTVIAKGMRNTTAKELAGAVGDIKRNLKLAPQDIPAIWEALSHVTEEYNLEIGKMGPSLTRATEMASQWGFKSVKGMQELLTIIGVVKEATGDEARAAEAVSHLLANIGNEALGLNLGYAPGEFFNKYKDAAEKNLPVVSMLIQDIAKSADPRKTLRDIGIRDELIVNKLLSDQGRIGDAIDKTAKATGALQKGLNLVDSPSAAIGRLTNSLSSLALALGKVMELMGATTVINAFAAGMENIAGTVSRLVDLLNLIFNFELPSWWPSSWGEAGYRLVAPRDKGGKLITPYDAYQRGADVPAERDAYLKRQQDAKDAQKAREKKVIEDEKRRRDQELDKQYPGSRKPDDSGIKLKKVTEAAGDVGKQLVGYTAATHGPEIANIIKASLRDAGGQYGGAMDAKYLSAGYTPSGRGYFGGAAPGGDARAGGGTGYDGGTRLAPPYEGGPRGPGQAPGGGLRPSGPPAPPGAPRQGVPEGPGAPPPQGPGEPLPEGYKGLVDPITGTLGGGLGDYRSGGGGHAHQGVDLLARHGSTIYSSGAGTIIKHSPHGSYQKDAVTTIRLDDGRTVRYMHHRLDPRLKVGDRLAPGQPIGTSGTAAGVGHLHYEMRDPQGRLMDPIKAHEWSRGRGGRTPVGGQASGAPRSPGAPPPATAQPAPPSPGAPAAPGAQAAPQGPGPPGGPGSAPITAGPGGVVDQEALNRRLEHLISQDPNLAGYLPPDAAAYGFKTGSAKEWAGLMTGMAGKESSFRAGLRGDAGKFGGAGSTGLFQLSPQDAITYGLQKTPFTQAQLADPDFNARMAVKIAGIRARAGGIGGREGMAKYWAGHGKRSSYLANREVRAGKDTGAAAAAAAAQPESTFGGRMPLVSGDTSATQMPLFGGEGATSAVPIPQVGGDMLKKVSDRAAENWTALNKAMKEAPHPPGFKEDASKPGAGGIHTENYLKHLERQMEGELAKPKIPYEDQEPRGGKPGEFYNPRTGQPQGQEVNLRLNVNDTEMQFARASLRRQADREVREARWNSYADIGAA